MPEGGRLTIETAEASFAETPSDLREYVRIAITDSGSGMSADTRARAFEPFFTTKQLGEGTGLGLAQVYGFITQSGGYCRLDSEPGKGTTVTFFWTARMSMNARPRRASENPLSWLVAAAK